MSLETEVACRFLVCRKKYERWATDNTLSEKYNFFVFEKKIFLFLKKKIVFLNLIYIFLLCKKIFIFYFKIFVAFTINEIIIALFGSSL